MAEQVRIQGGRKRHKAATDHIGSELADVLISLTTLANTYNVDLEKEIKKFQTKLEERRK